MPCHLWLGLHEDTVSEYSRLLDEAFDAENATNVITTATTNKATPALKPTLVTTATAAVNRGTISFRDVMGGDRSIGIFSATFAEEQSIDMSRYDALVIERSGMPGTFKVLVRAGRKVAFSTIARHVRGVELVETARLECKWVNFDPPTCTKLAALGTIPESPWATGFDNSNFVMNVEGSLLDADAIARAVEKAVNSKYGLYRKGLDFPSVDVVSKLSVNLVDDEDAIERKRSAERRQQIIDHLVAGEYVKASNVLHVDRRPIRVPDSLKFERYADQAALAICLRQARAGSPPSLGLFAYLASCEEKAKLAKATESSTERMAQEAALNARRLERDEMSRKCGKGPQGPEPPKHGSGKANKGKK